MKETRGGAVFVGIGILLSRLSGFLRETVFAAAFGNSATADAFKAALRIPNLLQNLLGEGVLSAAFIPVYVRLRAAGRIDEARHVASAVLSVLMLLCGLFSGLGILYASSLITVITPGFEGERRELAVRLVQIFFPATSFLVLSAWCLGVLNSHRRFLLSYAAPVVWNGAIIAVLLVFRGAEQQRLAILTAWGVVAGSILQFLVQLPSVWRLLDGISWTTGGEDRNVRLVLTNVLPVAFGRGVVQVSAFIDSMIASLLTVGSVAALSYAQMIYLLPVSLFGMSISAAELPRLSEAGASEDIELRNAEIRRRGAAALQRMYFFTVPTVAFFLCSGVQIVAALLQYGQFQQRDASLVASILAALSIGLLFSTASRLYSSTFYAVGLPNIPLRGAILRVVLSSSLGAFLALGIFPQYQLGSSVIGLSLGSSIGSLFEFYFLRERLKPVIGLFPHPPAALVRLFISASIAALSVSALQLFLGESISHVPYPSVVGLGVSGLAFSALYLSLAGILGISEVREFLTKLRRRLS